MGAMESFYTDACVVSLVWLGVELLLVFSYVALALFQPLC
jgi:hypothetical protein